MENLNKPIEPISDGDSNFSVSGNRMSTRVLAGIVLLIIGLVVLLKRLGLEIPDILLTWPMALIAFGLFLGLKSNFRGWAWILMIIAGKLFLIQDLYPDLGLSRFIWPLMLIGTALVFIFKKDSDYSKHVKAAKMKSKLNAAMGTSAMLNDTGEFVESTSIFSGNKKTILSKNLQGGYFTNIFGGVEIDLSMADFESKAVIDVTQVFGGTTIIVPSNWNVVTDMASIFGGIEDKRNKHNNLYDPNKTLVIKGTSIFGGIEITNYA